MARITKSDSAPADAKHFSLGNVEFDLERKNSVYETEDAAVLANARVHPYLQVEEDHVAPDAAVAVSDPLDPHQNPSADHLSSAATPAAVAAAEANEAAIREATGLADSTRQPTTDEPTVAETLAATFNVAAPDAEPVFAADAEESAEAPPADAQGGGTTEPPADKTNGNADKTTPNAPGKDD